MINTLSFLIFSALSGYFEAYFWESRPKVNQRWSHIALTILRSCILIPILIHDGWILCAALACFFPLIHDGMYYHTRNKINPRIYGLGWMDHSNSTGALISLDFVSRVIVAACGIITYMIWLSF